MKTKKKLHVNDTVIAADRGMGYEAKIVKIQKVGNVFKYFIHYNKWDRKYDSWVDESAITAKDDPKSMESLHEPVPSAAFSSSVSKKSKKNSHDGFSEKWMESSNASASATTVVETTNEIKTRKRSKLESQSTDISNTKISSMQELMDNSNSSSGDLNFNSNHRNNHTNQNKKSKKSDLSEPKNAIIISKQQIKSLAESGLCQDDEKDQRIMNKIGIPMPLKKFMVDEWGVINTTSPITERKLVKLPREFTVNDVIMKYLLNRKEKLSEEEFPSYVSFFKGLQLYFDRALPVLLLYRQERVQYDFISRELPNRRPSEIYGCEHLNRLFLKFHRLMSGIIFNVGEESSVMSKLSDFFKFLLQDMETYFDIRDYVLAAEAMTVISREVKKYPHLLIKKESKSKETSSSRSLLQLKDSKVEETFHSEQKKRVRKKTKST